MYANLIIEKLLEEEDEKKKSFSDASFLELLDLDNLFVERTRKTPSKIWFYKSSQDVTA